MRTTVLTACVAGVSLLHLAADVQAPNAQTRAQTRAQPQARQAQVRPPEPTFNLFSLSADSALGVASAKEAETQLPMYADTALEQYLNRIVVRLGAAAPGHKFPFHVRVVDAAEVNAFSLPGGPMYLTRGMLAVTQTEPEVAAILAHEMAHIVLRHGTNNASKVYLGKSGLGILGGLNGDRSAQPVQVVATIGGVGLNLAFVKFLDDDEVEADAMAARIMAGAGYDPKVLPSLLARARELQQKDSISYARYFRDHPENRERSNRLLNALRDVTLEPVPEIGGFAALRAKLPGLPPAVADSVLAATPRTTGTDKLPWPLEASDSSRTNPDPVVVSLPPPSAKYTKYTHPRAYFSIDHPAEWQVFDSTPGFGVVIAPIGGIVTRPNGARSVAEGLILSHYAPFDGEIARATLSLRQHFAPMTRVDGRRPRLEDATDDLVRTIVWTNPHLAAPNGSAVARNVAGDRSYMVLLTGLSPWTGQEECVVAFTRELDGGHVVFAIGVAQKRNFEILQLTFDRMVKSLEVNEAAVHRTGAPAVFRPR